MTRNEHLPSNTSTPNGKKRNVDVEVLLTKTENVCVSTTPTPPVPTVSAPFPCSERTPGTLWYPTPPTAIPSAPTLRMGLTQLIILGSMFTQIVAMGVGTEGVGVMVGAGIF